MATATEHGGGEADLNTILRAWTDAYPEARDSSDRGDLDTFEKGYRAAQPATPAPSADGGGGGEEAISAAREAGRKIAGDQPGALVEAFGEITVAGARAALASRTPAPGAAGVANAFDLGFEWASHLFGSPQNLEDSRAVARTLGSDLFDGLGVDPDAVTPSRMAEEAIVQAKAEIKRALLAAARGTSA